MTGAPTLFDPRSSCPRCGVKRDGARWSVREEDGGVREVCAVCARDFPNGRRRQVPTK